MDTVDRIFDLLGKSGMEQQEFARCIGTYPQTVSLWGKRKSASYRKYLPQIAHTLGTSVQWLLTGEEQGSGQAGSLDKLTLAERQLVLAYRRADRRARDMVDLALEPFKAPSQSDKAM